MVFFFIFFVKKLTLGNFHSSKIQIHSNEKKDENQQTKKWLTYELDDYSWTTYGEAKEMTDKMAAYLQQRGLKAGDRMLIYAKTRYKSFPFSERIFLNDSKSIELSGCKWH